MFLSEFVELIIYNRKGIKLPINYKTMDNLIHYEKLTDKLDKYYNNDIWNFYEDRVNYFRRVGTFEPLNKLPEFPQIYYKTRHLYNW